MEFKKSTTPEDLNERVKVAQRKIEVGYDGAREAHFELNKLAENADDFREEFEQENKDWDNLHLKQEIKKGEGENDLENKKLIIEKRRQEAVELMLKEKAVEINEKNFNFKLFGIPDGFDIDSNNTKNGDETSFYQMFYNEDKSDKSLQLIKNRFGKVMYVYKRNNFLSVNSRPGAFLGMSIELDEIYCTDFEKLEKLFDSIFEKLIVEKYNLVKKNEDPDLPYIFSVDSFRNKKVQQEIAELKGILLKNFKSSFAKDFRKNDENFEKFDKIARAYNLHKITKVTRFIDDKGIEQTVEGFHHTRDKKYIEEAETKTTAIEEIKPFDSKYFDFDRNAINDKYDKELTELGEAEKKD